MSNSNCETPAVLPGCSVMSPLELPATQPAVTTTGKRPGKPKRTAVATCRFRSLNDFIDYSMCGLSKAESGTWFVLFRDTKQNGTARTSMEDIARRVGVCRRTIVNAVKRLKELELLTVVYQGGLHGGMNVYRVNALGNRSRS